MAATLDMLPNELLCNILGMLSTEEKFQVREVCSTWKNLIDTCVPFYDVIIGNGNADLFGKRYGTRRVVSMEICGSCKNGYCRPTIPIQNLSFLRYLILNDSKDMNVGAVADLARRAENLKELEIFMSSQPDSKWHEKKYTEALLPALRRINNLRLLSNSDANALIIFNAWEHILRDKNANLQRLEISVLTSLQNNFIRFAILKPNLSEFSVQVQEKDEELENDNILRVVAVWSKDSNSGGLRKINLVCADFVINNQETQWKTLLSNQSNLEVLRLDNSWDLVGAPSYAFSLIQPVFMKNMESLHTIRLDIDKEGSDFDMEIFAPFVALRNIDIRVREEGNLDESGNFRVRRGIKNCSTIISVNLLDLHLQGFKFTMYEADDVIEEIAILDCAIVEFFKFCEPEVLKKWISYKSQILKITSKKEVLFLASFLASKWYAVGFCFDPLKCAERNSNT